MNPPKSKLGLNETETALGSGNGTLILSTLALIESQPPFRTLLEALQRALSFVTDPVLLFQIKKTYRQVLTRQQGKKIRATTETVQKLLNDPARLDDLALVTSCLVQPEAILAADLLRSAGWQNFPAPILPTFCAFFREFGNLMDVPAILELCRHPDPTVLTVALKTLEKIDPQNMQEIIVPLLDSQIPGIRAQAIQAYYRWNKAAALSHLVKMLFSDLSDERMLAIHHANHLPYPETEPHLLRFITGSHDPQLLIPIGRLMNDNAHVELPFKLYWLARTLPEEHRYLIKGLILGIIRSLAAKKVIDLPVQDFLEQVKERVKNEEERLLKDSIEPEISLPSTDKPEANDTKTAKPDEPSDIVSEDEAEDDSGIPQIPDIPALKEYNQLGLSARIKLLSGMNSDNYQEFKSSIPALFKSSKGKELAGVIKLVGRFGNINDAKLIKPILKSTDPNEVCAAITALARLDSEYLCLFLPQYMQDKNGKIRMHATKALVTIDHTSIRRLIGNLLASSTAKLRLLAVSASMLVDFTLVRDHLMCSYAKETVPELINKMGLVLASNPDREIFRTVFRTGKKGKGEILAERDKITQLLAANLSIALNKISTSEELLAVEEETLAAEEPEEPPPSETSEKSMVDVIEDERLTNVSEILTSNKEEAKEKRAKITIIIWVMVLLAWGSTLFAILTKWIFGD